MRRPDASAARVAVPILAVLCLMSAAAATAQGMGWRTDGTGIYPQATPITTWSPEDNVLWATELDGFTNSIPIIVGDKVFTLAEPGTLVCIDRNDGSILWQRENKLEDLAEPAEVDKIAEAHKQAREWRQAIGKANGQMWKAKQDLQDKPEDEALKAKIKELEEQVKGLQEKLKPYEESWYGLPDVHGTNGFTSATPVTDGERVYILLATGLAAAYDLDGNRLWARVVGKPRVQWGPSQSPLVCGDKLIVHPHDMLAVNKLTGEEVWRAELPERWGTPFITNVGETQVLVTASGHFVRVADGKVLARANVDLEYSAPVVADGVAYFIQHGGCAVKLPEAVVDDALALQELWRTEPKKERYYASPVVYDGLIYAIMQKGIISVIDAATGQVIREKQLPFGKSVGYPSPALAGGYLYFSDDAGNTWVMKPGKELEDVAQNKLEPFRSSPVFIGDRLYIRGLSTMYGLGSS